MTLKSSWIDGTMVNLLGCKQTFRHARFHQLSNLHLQIPAGPYPFVAL